MDALLFRVRVAVLWMAVAVAMTASLVLFVFEPGAVEDLLAGEMEGETLTSGMGLLMAMFGIAPLVLAGISLLISDRANRWVSLIAGTAFGLFGAYAVGSHLSAGDTTAHVLLVAVAGLTAFLIAGIGLVSLRSASEAKASVAGSSRYHKPTTV